MRWNAPRQSPVWCSTPLLMTTSKKPSFSAGPEQIHLRERRALQAVLAS